MKNILKHSGLFLLLFLTLMVLGTTLLFFIHVSISRFHLIGFLIITSIIYYFITKKKLKTKDYIITLLLSILVILASMLVATYTFDRSSDGVTYHKDAIGVLKEGFNPVYQESYDFIKKRDNSTKLTNYSIWTDHYAKANWIMASNFYSLTNNIETGKAMNFISMYIVFSLVFTYLIDILDKKKSLVLTLLLVINPITAAQMLTFYNDQLVCLYLFLSVFCLIKLDKDLYDKETWFTYILTFILLSNAKFNGLGYLLVFSFLFVCKYLYKSYKEKHLFKTFKRLSIIFIPLFIVSLLIVGYPTYVKNTIDHNNPFFPLYDDNGEDIITEQEPKSFIHMNTIEKLYYGTFSKANNLRDNDNTTIKIPFTVYKDEITPAMSNDLRISGWGILFSGLLIVSICVLITKFKDYKKEDYILYTLGITIILLLVMSESWWARYTPHFYFFILFSLYILLKYEKNKWLRYLFIVLVSINTLIPLGGNIYYTFSNSIKIRNDLTNLKNKEIVLEENAYNGILYNLKDFNVKYSFEEDIDGKELYYHYLEYKEK